ncbi:MAG TPA: carbon-nitrogen hydrolase family protein [bacterium]|nr:carbon-nitrogen hydrolase family protein [bacterium]HQL62307.1 carbon-nitrogen hydrolase family protein [bacterium]
MTRFGRGSIHQQILALSIVTMMCVCPTYGASDEKETQDKEKTLITVALLQMLPKENDRQANLVKGEEYCRRAAAMGADIALMPEMWSNGYSGLEDKSEEAIREWQSRSVPRDGEFVGHFLKLAGELNMAIAVTYLETWEKAPRNTMTLIDRHGKMALTYAKVHTCDFGLNEAVCTPGEDFPVCELGTAHGSIRVGAMICYDREQPESARILMLNGAELILVPNACTLRHIFVDQLRIRALENALAVAMTNYPAPKFNGSSAAFTAGGDLIVEAGDAEGIYLAPFDFEKIRENRRKTIWGNAFRRPHRYQALLENHGPDVFKRNNALDQPFRVEER